MKTSTTPGDLGGQPKTVNPGKSRQNSTNPKKPNNDPDQTPEREVENVPRAKPSKGPAPAKTKIGFKK